MEFINNGKLLTLLQDVRCCDGRVNYANMNVNFQSQKQAKRPWRVVDFAFYTVLLIVESTFLIWLHFELAIVQGRLM
jgi:hypothetical protein